MHVEKEKRGNMHMEKRKENHAWLWKREKRYTEQSRQDVAQQTQDKLHKRKHTRENQIKELLPKSTADP